MAQKPETVFRQNKVLPFLKKLKRCVVFPIQQQAIRGTPDLLICLCGIFVALELKSSGGRASKLQSYFCELIISSGGFAYVVTPENWSEIKEILQAIEQLGGTK